jgi:hypothetical protein
MTIKPVEGASITLLGPAGRELDQVVRSNKFGVCSMRVESNKYRLRNRRLGYQPVDSDIVDVRPGEDVSLSYVLTGISLRMTNVVVKARPGLETGARGMAAREPLGKGVFLYAKDFAEIANKPLWEILDRVEGLRARVDGSMETLSGHGCLQFMINRLKVVEIPMQWVTDLNNNGQSLASLYEMIPDGLAIRGIEIYRDFGEVPEELRQDAWPFPEEKGYTPPRVLGPIRNRTLPNNPCGLINVWTSAAWG